MSSPVRVRFAPSPTGLLHIGGARTALFNWLYARHTGGVFVLRIEDTDAARNTQEATDIIFAGLTWLGLDWDEGAQKGGDCGPYFQSQRTAIYQAHLDRLLASGHAYKEATGGVRFRLPKTPVTVNDLICGNPVFDLSNDPDITLQRPDGSFIFHFVNVVDDIEMKITHVIRGEDHLSNTPKHIALYEALGATPPAFGHIPLILNSNGSKMSKRDTGSSIGDYMAQGYDPRAVRNYLCLLGWSPKDNREVFPIEEAARIFDLPQVNRSNARFDIDKLYWMNGEYIRAMTPAEFTAFAKPILAGAGIDTGTDDAYLTAVLGLLQEKIKLGRDIPEWARYFFTEDFPFDEKAKAEKLDTPAAQALLAKLIVAFTELPAFDAVALEGALKTTAAAVGVKNAALVHPCRVAVSGSGVGPSLYHMLEVLGRDRVLARLRRAV